MNYNDPEEFAKAHLEGWTVAWPNGADFAPEFLYELDPEGERSGGWIGRVCAAMRKLDIALRTAGIFQADAP